MPVTGKELRAYSRVCAQKACAHTQEISCGQLCTRTHTTKRMIASRPMPGGDNEGGSVVSSVVSVVQSFRSED